MLEPVNYRLPDFLSKIGTVVLCYVNYYRKSFEIEERIRTKELENRRVTKGHRKELRRGTACSMDVVSSHFNPLNYTIQVILNGTHVSLEFHFQLVDINNSLKEFIVSH